MKLNTSVYDRFSVSGKTAIVTGGLGILGTEYTRTLLAAGARVAVFDINTGEVNDFYKSLSIEDGLIICEVDIRRRAAIEKGVRTVTETLGIPSILINNAALDTPPGASALENGPFEDYPEDSLDITYAVNQKGMILCCQVVGGCMAGNGGGSIINISSIYGNVSPDQRIYAYRREEGAAFYKPVSYSVTKSAVLNLTRYLATYWAEKKIRVNTLSLGGVFNHQDDRFLEEYCKRVPMGRMADQHEYSEAILFLASDASSYMTGANLIMDGGFTAW